jgi:hypothetical protein
MHARGARTPGGDAMNRLLVFVVYAFAALAHADAPRFAWHAPLAVDDAHAFHRVELPAAVYEGVVRSDLADVRVRNGDGEAVPFAFLPVPSADRERAPAVDLPLFPLFVDDDARNLGDLDITVRRDGGGTRVDLAAYDWRPIEGRRLAGYLIEAGAPAAPALDALREAPEVKRWLLWAALALATVVLAWMAFALLRQMRTPPSRDRETGPPV